MRRPYHLHNVYEYPGCLYRFTGAHPPQVTQMWQDITAKDSACEIRQIDDIEALLNSRRYQLGRYLVMSANTPSLWIRQAWIQLKGLLARLLPSSVKDALKRL